MCRVCSVCRAGKHGTAWRASRDIPQDFYARVTADEAGKVPCDRAVSSALCTSCSAHTRRLCDCALTKKSESFAPARWLTQMKPSAMTRPDFDGNRAWRCCVNGSVV